MSVLRAGKPISSLIAQTCGAIAAAFGFLALSGWAFDLPALTTLGQGWIPMAPSTALLFALLGSAVFSSAGAPLSRAAHWAGVAIGSAGALIGLLLFILSYMGIRLEAEHIGFTIAGTVGGAPIGHMSPVTALCFTLAGLSLVATLTSAGRQVQAMTTFWMSGLLVLASVVFLLAYLFGTPLLYGGKFIPPALTTSIALAALGTALLALTGPRAWAPERQIDAETLRASLSFVLVFALMTVGLVSAGGIYYRRDVAQDRAEIERQLSAIADLKLSELLGWRRERFGDARLLHGNIFFADLVRRALGGSRDAYARYQLHNWLRQIRDAYGYEEVTLIDAQGLARISVPDKPLPAAELEIARQAMRSGLVSLEDFHRDEPGGKPHLSLLVPILDAEAGGRPFAVVVLGIDPDRYLYPMIGRWPTPSASGETLLVRRDGDDVLYLNELRFRKNTALSLRYPLTRTEKPAVKAVLGHEGIVEGTDYRGAPVIAAVRAVPGTPWFLITRIATEEFLASIEEALWLTAGLIAALLLSCGAALGLLWRHQRVRHYKERTRAAEALAAGSAQLARQKDLYNMLSQTNQAIVRMTRREELFPAVCRIAVQFGRFRHAWIAMIDKGSQSLKPLAHYGEDSGYVQQIRVSVDAADDTGRAPAGQAFRAGHYVVSNDFLNDQPATPWKDRARRAGVRASAAFPISEGGAVVGVMVLSAAEPGAFTDDLLPTLDEMALDVSFALDNFERQAEFKRAIEALRESESRYRSLFENMLNGYAHCRMVYDDAGLPVDFVYLDVNKSFERLTGLKNVVGKPVSEVIPGIRAVSPELFQAYGRVASTGSPETFEFDFKSQNQWYTVSVYSPKQGYFVAVFDDITERKRTEQRLMENRALLQAIVNGTSDAIYVKDRQGRYLLFNTAAEGFTGKSAGEALGKDDYFLFPPADAATIMEGDRKVIESGTLATYEEVLTDIHGRVLTFLSTKGPISDASGKLIGLFGVARNITERKVMEGKLRDSVAFREFLLEAIPLPVFHKDALGRYTGCNRAFTKFLGKTESEIVGKTVYEVSPQSFAQTYRDKDLELLDGPVGMQVYESCIKHADGTAHDVIFHKARVVDNAGRATGIIGVIMDITERKRAEEALRESEARYRSVFANSSVPMLLIDPADGRIQDANLAACAYYGWDLTALRGKLIFDINTAPRELVHAELRRVRDQNKRRFEFRHRLANGEVRDVEIFSGPVEIGGRSLILSIIEDVTERKKALDSLRAAEEQFRGLVEQTIAGIYIVQDGKLVYVNPRFGEIFGYGSAGEVIGRDALSLIAENERAAVDEGVRTWLKGGKRSFTYTTSALRQDGSTIEVGVHSTRANYQGRPAIIGMMQDISEKKRAEEQIQHYIAQLQKAFMHTVEVATTLSEMRDPYTAGHERRVAEIAVAIGTELGLDARRLEGLRVAGYLHDIGKMTVPAEILSKPGKLTAIEMQLIRQHPQASYDVLKNVEFPWPVAEFALQHHERMDGSGYPRGLKGEDIVLEARILAAADTVEAMSSHRPYRPGLGIDQALAEIERGRGSAFDPIVADACLRLFREKGYSLPV